MNSTSSTVPVVGRYAPSPSGRLHLGNARTALLAWLSVRGVGGRFVMRIEDLDAGRSRPHFEQGALEDLRWLGLDWDEGPDVGGPNGPYRQSECAGRYAAAAAKLETYPCTCTRKELREATVAPHGAEPVYPGICANGPSDPTRPSALRWRVCSAGEPTLIEVHDRWQPPLTQSLQRDVGDFVVRRNDGAFAYQLAVVLDDAVMGVTEVVRGADLWASTPRQVALGRALELPIPAFAHAPLLCGPTGAKLSKRDGAPDLHALREAGVDPAAVVAWLADSVGLVVEDTPSVPAGALAEQLAADWTVQERPVSLTDPRLGLG